MPSPTMPSLASSPPAVSEHEEHGLLILKPADQRPIRRILFINVSGGTSGWRKYKAGLMPSNRLWGCVELLRMGYEIGIAESLPDFYYHRNPLPHDLRLLRTCNDWLRADDIVYCAHNTLFWLPLLRKFGFFHRNIVSLLYAREPLDLSTGHSGIIALNPAAAEHARRLAPKAKVAHLGWGMDLDFLPQIPFQPEWFLSCGRTNRDYDTLHVASGATSARIRLIGHAVNSDLKWPDHVEIAPGGQGWETRLTYRELLHDYYGGCIASLIILKPDPIDYTACGFTNLLEAMAMGRPAVLTRTNAIRSEIDVVSARCGLTVAPENPDDLANAINHLARHPEFARQLGEAGRRLCETHYNMKRFASDLHRFFASL